MADDNVINNPQDPAHLPVSGEFDSQNPHADDSDPLNSAQYEETTETTAPDEPVDRSTNS